jgi:D-arabinose 1-dehydrogenase-like Zn-dependent alcohol dehydrogenase
MLAEHVLLHENAFVHLPDYMSYIEAASLPCAAVTAWSALNLATPLHPGQTVLIQGRPRAYLNAARLVAAVGARWFTQPCSFGLRPPANQVIAYPYALYSFRFFFL